MEIKYLSLKGAALVETSAFEDERGIFARFFCAKELAPVIGDRRFVNINFSQTMQKGALRGMHFQQPPAAEMKLVRCVSGAVYDVIVDIRKGSETFLKWFGVELSAQTMNLLCVPEGFAHGFQALTDNAEILYMVSEYYTPGAEAGLNYADPAIGIKWPLAVSVISQKDAGHQMLGADYAGLVLPVDGETG